MLVHVFYAVFIWIRSTTDTVAVSFSPPFALSLYRLTAKAQPIAALQFGQINSIEIINKQTNKEIYVHSFDINEIVRVTVCLSINDVLFYDTQAALYDSYGHVAYGLCRKASDIFVYHAVLRLAAYSVCK